MISQSASKRGRSEAEFESNNESDFELKEETGECDVVDIKKLVAQIGKLMKTIAALSQTVNKLNQLVSTLTAKISKVENDLEKRVKRIEASIGDILGTVKKLKKREKNTANAHAASTNMGNCDLVKKTDESQ